MANHSKNKNLKEQAFVMRDGGKVHRPKKKEAHIARELKVEAGDEDLRRLLPAAQDRVMGRPVGTTKHLGWHPSGGRSLRRIEMNVRGGMVG